MIESIKRYNLTKEKFYVPVKYYNLLARYCKDLGNSIVDIGELILKEEFNFIKPHIFVYFKMRWSNNTITTHIVRYKGGDDYIMTASIYTVHGEVDSMVTSKLEQKEKIIVTGILDILYKHPLQENYKEVKFINNTFSFN